ncbi:DUF2510 domain-containing protein [Nocardia sp. CA-107356]|uniref:DUF2510 domain-containing protein n=1 Tax=Nocardia sp. CA-107356 TaxID=3239972 RepID=UPI003D92A2DC
MPPDWYPDPSDVGFLRYWNGTDWTADRKPVPAKGSVDRPQAGGPAAKVPLFGARAHAKRRSQELADAQPEELKRFLLHGAVIGGKRASRV